MIRVTVGFELDAEKSAAIELCNKLLKAGCSVHLKDLLAIKTKGRTRTQELIDTMKKIGLTAPAKKLDDLNKECKKAGIKEY